MEVRDSSARCALFAEEASEFSDVGPIPRSWPVRTLGEIADVSAGGTPSRSVPSYWGEGVPWITTSEVDSSNIEGAAQSITKEGLKNSAAKLLRPGTLLLALYGQGKTRGKVGRLQIAAATNQACAAIEIDPTHSSGFVFHYLRSQYENIRKLSNTGNQENLSGTIVRSINIPVPPPAEQQAIAEALSDADALIESLSLLLAKKRQIKQGAMQELLTGKKRLPGFSGDWMNASVGSVAEVDPENLPAGTSCDFFFNYIALEDVERGELKSHSEQLFGSAPSRARRRLRHGDVLVGTVRPTLQSHLLFEEKQGEWVSSTGFAAVRSDGRLHPGYLFEHLFGAAVNRQIDALLTGSNYPAINSRHVRGLVIPLPAYEEQTAIFDVLSSMNEEIASLELKLAKARDLKQGMMQALLSGRIRLVQPASNVIRLPTKPAANVPTDRPAHNWQINEAVVIGVLAQHFGSDKMPLGRKRRVKLTYLLHRHAEGRAEGYLKKAAGPYDPNTKYKGPEQIALKNGYVRVLRKGKYEGFIAGDKIEQAQRYFDQWYGAAALAWLERFHYRKTDDLELLATVDMAMVDLAVNGEPADVGRVKRVIAAHPEWLPKLSRELFSDKRIAAAITECAALFPA